MHITPSKKITGLLCCTWCSRATLRLRVNCLFIVDRYDRFDAQVPSFFFTSSLSSCSNMVLLFFFNVYFFVRIDETQVLRSLEAVDALQRNCKHCVFIKYQIGTRGSSMGVKCMGASEITRLTLRGDFIVPALLYCRKCWSGGNPGFNNNCNKKKRLKY